jgi:TP901 family phage tail tape measure protein
MAKKISGLTIAINADTSGVTAGLKDLTKESISLSQQLKTVDKLLEMDPHNVEVAATKQKLLSDATETTRKKLEALKGAQADVQAQFERGDIGTREYVAFQEEIVRTESRLRDLENQTGETGDEMQEAASQSSGFGDVLKDGLATAAGLAVDALKAAADAAIDFAKESVTTGMDFDAAMSQIAATAGMTVDDLNADYHDASESAQKAQDDFNALREKAMEMGAETAFSAEEAAQGLNILMMSGYDATQACEMIPDVLNLASAGSLDLASSAKFVSGAIKGFADDTKDAQYYADLMAKGATLASTDVNALGEALSGSAATAASYGQSADDVTVSLLRLAEQGATGSEAATMLARAMADVYTATPAAADALEQLGVKAYDSQGNAREFGDIVEELNTAFGKMSDEEANALKNTIFTTNGLKAFNKMTVTSKDKVNEWSDALANSAGSAAAQAEVMLDNLSGDVKKFGSATDGLKLAVSDALSPALRQFVQFGTDSVGEITQAFKDNGLEGAIETFAGKIPILIEQFLPKVIKAATSITRQLVDALPDILKAVGTAIPELIAGARQMAPALLKSAKRMIKILADGLVKSLPEMVPAIVDIALEIVDVLTDPDTLGLLVDAAIQITIALADGLINALPEILDKAPEIIENLCNALVDNLPKLLDAAWTLISKFAEYLLDGKNIDKIATAAFDIIVNLYDSIVGALWKVAEFCRKIVQKIADEIGLGDYWKMGADIIDEFMGGIVDKWNEWKSWWEGFGEYIYDALHPNAEEGDDTPQALGDYMYDAANGHAATGAYITRPTRLLTGEGGKKEVVLPLEQNTGWADILADKLAAAGGGGVQIASIVVNAGLGADGRRIADDLVAELDTRLRQRQITAQRGTGGLTW